MLKNRLFTVYLNFTMSGNCFLVIVKNLGGKISETNFVFLKQKFEMRRSVEDTKNSNL